MASRRAVLNGEFWRWGMRAPDDEIALRLDWRERCIRQFGRGGVVRILRVARRRQGFEIETRHVDVERRRRVGRVCAERNAGVAFRALGVRRATLSAVVNGHAALSPELALRIEKAFAVNMEMLLRMQAWYDAHAMRRHAGAIDVKRYRAVLNAPKRSRAYARKLARTPTPTGAKAPSPCPSAANYAALIRCLPNGRWFDERTATWPDGRGRVARWPDLVEATRYRKTRVVARGCASRR